MRTAQIIRRLNFQEWGGTESVVWNSVRELNKLGIESESLATLALGGAEDETLDNVHIRRFPCFYPYFPLGAERRNALDRKGGNPISFALAEHLNRHSFDLIHCHNLGRLAQYAARAARHHNVPLVLSLHGGYADVPKEELDELLKPIRHTIPYGGILERVLRTRVDAPAAADGLICVGANEYEALRERYPDKRVMHLPNGVDTARFARRSSFDWREELNLAPETRLLLNVSRIDYQKNQKLLIRLMAELASCKEDAHLLLIGPVTSAWYAEELRRLMKELGVENRVTLIPGLPPGDERLEAAYQGADLFLLPSNHEPFGIVVLEAWSAGLPVIAARVGGLGRLVEDGRTGLFFEAGSLEGLVDAYRRLPSCRKALVENALLEVRENYDWRIVAGMLKTFYRELCDGRKHSIRQ